MSLVQQNNIPTGRGLFHNPVSKLLYVPAVTFGTGQDVFQTSQKSSQSTAKGWKERLGETIAQKAYRWMSGLSLSIPDLERERAHWESVVKKTVEAMEQESLEEQFPAIVQKLKDFQIEEYIGIPPMIQEVDAKGVPTGKRTHGIVTEVGIKILKELPRVNSAEAAVGQHWETFKAVYDKASEKGRNLKLPNIKATTMTAKGMKIIPLDGKLFSAIHANSLVFIAPNGAIQFVKPPDAKTLVQMIRQDALAQEALKQKSPLKSFRLLSMIEIGRRIPFETVITNLEKGEIHRDKAEWSDILTLLRSVPFDFPKHIAAGRLKLQLNKPGQDGKTVWESVTLA